MLQWKYKKLERQGEMWLGGLRGVADKSLKYAVEF
jgi:hypothetical protein